MRRALITGSVAVVRRVAAQGLSVLAVGVLWTLAGAVEPGTEGGLTAETVKAQCEEKHTQYMGDFGLAQDAEFEARVRQASPAQLAQILEECLADLPATAVRTVDPAAIERGRAVYTDNGCTFCHGQDLRGGSGGPSLLRSQRLLRDKKGETIGEVVLKGVPNTAMTAFPLKPEALSDLAEFLHSVQQSSAATIHHPPSRVVGNAQAGQKFFARHCSGCHSATDLTAIGAKYSDSQVLQQRWLMPPGVLPVSARIIASNGDVVEGRVVHIDEFAVLLELVDGTRRLFDRAGQKPAVTLRDPLAGHKALLHVYSDDDIHNVTVYLQTLKASDPPKPTHRTPAVTPRVPAAPIGLLSGAILQPARGSWPTYAGDYSARRYSPLDYIDQANVKQLTLAWSTRLVAGANDTGSYPLVVAGEGPGTAATLAPAVVGSILQVNGVLYLSTPDNAWAIDARAGEIRWHFNWKGRSSVRLGNRGLGMWNDSLYLTTPDDYLVSLDAHTGEMRWHVAIADLAEQYFSSSPAPIVVGHHVLVGSGNLLDAPGFVKSFDPETGQLQWTHYSVPMNPDDPGLATWKDLDAARHGGGMVWMPGAYDPDTKLYIYGTGNPTPAYVAALRGNRDALFTCSIIAVDVETGRQAWHYQVSPNDTHDWDTGLTPVLADLTIGGRSRKVVMAAARNGYFFVLDRISGKHLLTSKFAPTTNWAQPGLNTQGQPVRIPAKDHQVSGALVSPANLGAANWYPASFSPDYELFYVPSLQSWAMYYTVDADAGGANSLQGKAEIAVNSESTLKAIDPKTGRVAWTVVYPSGGTFGSGVLTTAGRLLLSGDTGGNLVARDPANGRPLWHAHVGYVTNAPETYLLDGHQYILVAAGDTVYAFRLAGGKG